MIVNPPLPPVDVGGAFSIVTQGELGGAGYVVEDGRRCGTADLVMWAHGWRG